ncbi:MAG: protein-disulfide reductase DsbD [Gammaproteobacteria bacterium]|nr:protein-disulfide reductase DsbD [Gammaproteobacteria bacterium]
MKLKQFLLTCLGLYFALAALPSQAQFGESEFLPPDQAFKVEVFAEAADRLRVDFLVTPGYYLYRHRLNFKIDAAADAPPATLGTPDIPAGEWKEDEFFGRQQVYHESVSVTLPVSRAPGAALELPLVVGLQGCADKGLCYPPEKRRLKIMLPATSGTDFSGASAEAGRSAASSSNSRSSNSTPNSLTPFVSEQDRLAALIKSGNLPLVLATFFGLGLLLAFTPCVLPMVPILSGIIAGQGSNVTTGRAFALSLTYVMGMAVMNTLAGVAAAAAGQQIQALFQQPWIIILFALLFVVLALSMFGLFNIQLPAALQTRLADASNRQQAGTFGGVAVMGALSALIVTACVAPPLFAALAVIAQTGDVVRGGSALFAMSLGMGAPLLVIGTSAGRLLPKAGAWMDTVKKFFGVLMLAVAAWMLARLVAERWVLLLWAVPALTGAVLLWREVKAKSLAGWAVRAGGVVLGAYGLALLAGVVLGGKDPLSPIPQFATESKQLEFRLIKTGDDLDREIAAAAAAGRPAMLDFYADWCVSCKEMERYTFTDAEVQRVLANAVLLKADVTANDEADQALLRRFEIFGPPTIAFWGRDGIENKATRVVGFMKAEEFARVASLGTGASPVPAPAP